MIWNTRKRSESAVEYDCQDILDGQQRFITLLLLNAVMRDLSNEPDLQESVQKRLVQQANVYDNIPARDRIEFEIRDDKVFLSKHIITIGGAIQEAELIAVRDDSKSGASVRNMAKGLLVMC